MEAIIYDRQVSKLVRKLVAFSFLRPLRNIDHLFTKNSAETTAKLPARWVAAWFNSPPFFLSLSPNPLPLDLDCSTFLPHLCKPVFLPLA